ASRSLPEPASPVAETVVMAKITDETVVLFPMRDPDLDDEDKTEQAPARPPVETEPPDLVPAKPALAAAPRGGGGRRRRRKASKRGLIIGIMTLLLVLACAYLVLQYFNTPIGGGL
ncbi:MAG TPA: hypothetical protein VNP03_13595, partial [Pseudonocardia sp.]|nr:hypothetical protein [Pseudonocardia sp.]